MAVVPSESYFIIHCEDSLLCFAIGEFLSSSRWRLTFGCATPSLSFFATCCDCPLFTFNECGFVLAGGIYRLKGIFRCVWVSYCIVILSFMGAIVFYKTNGTKGVPIYQVFDVCPEHLMCYRIKPYIFVGVICKGNDSQSFNQK